MADELLLEEGVWARGWINTKQALGHWSFWVVEAFLLGTVAIVFSAELALALVALLALAVWVVAKATAPVRQRNDLKGLVAEKVNAVEKLSKEAPDLKVRFLQFMMGNVDETATDALIFFIEIRNVGRRPSSVLNHWIFLELDGETFELHGKKIEYPLIGSNPPSSRRDRFSAKNCVMILSSQK